MHGFGIADAIRAITGALTVLVVISLLLILAKIIVYSVLIFKCRKFKRETVQENFLGMKKLVVCTEIFIILDFVDVILGFMSLPNIVNLWSSGELTAADVLSWLFPIFMLIYGIYAWRCYLRAKRIYGHLFAKIMGKCKKSKYIDDDERLFGDSKMIDLNAGKKSENSSMESVGESHIQSQNVDMQKLKPLASGELVPCPYCESLNTYKSKICVFCGADLPYSEETEVAPINPYDMGVTVGKEKDKEGDKHG